MSETLSTPDVYRPMILLACVASEGAVFSRHPCAHAVDQESYMDSAGSSQAYRMESTINKSGKGHFGATRFVVSEKSGVIQPDPVLG
ncbi:MAG TPA: hypothetical protein PLN33_04315, partial [Hyphomonadaceae bacterium]|nr:hypothetical protein [Hyphomonadaceae bacterium]